jgi:dethiobiotin synthase
MNHPTRPHHNRSLSPPVFFVTGTDTGVGKTVLTVLLTEFARRCGRRIATLKPLCSGSRADAQRIHRALDGALSLNQINPWHFGAPIAPSAAAHAEKKTVTLANVRQHLRNVQAGFDLVLVEGAGGLLSPLGVDFNARHLISAWKATPIVVAVNKLGVVNHLLLTLEALSPTARNRARIVLMAPLRPDPSTALNPRTLANLTHQPVFRLPRFDRKTAATKILRSAQVRRTLGGLLADTPAGRRLKNPRNSA